MAYYIINIRRVRICAVAYQEFLVRRGWVWWTDECSAAPRRTDSASLSRPNRFHQFSFQRVLVPSGQKLIRSFRYVESYLPIGNKVPSSSGSSNSFPSQTLGSSILPQPGILKDSRFLERIFLYESFVFRYSIRSSFILSSFVK